MIPLLPNPFNPDDTEFVLDSDSFMAALTSDRPANARFLLEREVEEMRKSLAAYGRKHHAPSIAPERDAAEQPYRTVREAPRFTADAAGRRLDRAPRKNDRSPSRNESMHDYRDLDLHDQSQTPIVPDEDALFYLAGSLPLSIVPDALSAPKRK